MIKYSRNLAFSILLVVLVFLIYIRLNFEEGLKELSLNIISEIIGISITVLLIEKSFKQEAEERKNSLFQNVFRSLPIKRQLSFMRDMVYSLAPKGSFAKYSDIGNKNYYEYLKKLDFSSSGPGIWSNTRKKMSWADYITYNANEFNEFISKIITNYVLYLEPEELRILQSVVDSEFMRFAVKTLPMLMNIKGGLSDYHLFNTNGSLEDVEEYISLLWKLAKIYNKYCDPKDIIEIPSWLREGS